MKIGILTFSCADNYGALLQAYALKKTLEGRGHTVEIINYQDKRIISLYKIFAFNRESLGGFLKSFIKSCLKILQKETSKKTKCNSFRNKYLSLTKKVYKIDEVSQLEFDAIIVGSDQVWNVKSTRQNVAYFLPFDNSITKISYAASCGSTDVIKDNVDFFNQNLSRFDYISVREPSSANLLRSLFPNLDIYTASDPTLLASQDIWDQLIVHRIISKKYVLIYRMTYNSLIEKTALEYAKNNNCIVVSVSNFNRPHKIKGIKDIRGIGPKEFLNLIYYADFVVTDSFHATAFSLIFKKQFASISHDTLGSRTVDLLFSLNLNYRIVSSDERIQFVISNIIDYNDVSKKLAENRKESFDFLTKCKL